MSQLIAAMEIASIFCLVTMATLTTFRLAGFPDLSVDGVFTLGAVVLAKSIAIGLAWPIAFLLAILAGGLAGLITSGLAVKLKVNPLLASVLVLTMLYSVNLRILGRATQPLFEIAASFHGSAIVLPAIAVTLIALAIVIFGTEFGCALRSTGTSSAFLTSVGRNVDAFRICLVVGAGCLVALAGALMASRYGFADVSMGTGAVVVGIAAMIIGERLVGRYPFTWQVIAVPIGVVTYQLAVAVALSLGLQPTDVKLATGALAIALLASQRTQGEELIASGQTY